jgi:multicomponent Na+:H+ antiporter subunit D
MSQTVILPFLVMLSTAILTLVTRRWTKFQKLISLTGATAYVIAVANLMLNVFPANTLTYQLSNWPAPFGITFVADPLSAFMLSTTGLLILPALIFSFKYIDDYGHKVSFQPLFHFMILGITGAFMTGDIFNLFVWFEVILMSSYILMSFYGGKQETRATFQYVVMNLIGSAFMLLAIGGIYATTGTLNMAHLAQILANPGSGAAVTPVLGLSGLLLCVFALKAGIAPFQFWAPPAYKAAPAPVSAILAGAAKKVGIYAIIRLYFGIFAAANVNISMFGVNGNNFLAFYGPIMLLMAIASIFIGGLGAIKRETIDEVLAYSSIGQVGFIILPLAIAAMNTSLAPVAIAASLIYVLNHAVAKGMLFMAAGAVETAAKTQKLEEIGGLADNSRMLSAAFLIGALSLIGIPPLLGFFGKMLVFQSATANIYAIAAGLLGGILTIVYFSRVWNKAFWGETINLEKPDGYKTMVAAVTALAAVIVVAGAGSQVVIENAQHAADTALDTQDYSDAVLGDFNGTTEYLEHESSSHGTDTNSGHSESMNNTGNHTAETGHNKTTGNHTESGGEQH